MSFSDQVVTDIETSVIPGVRDFLGNIEAPAHYKKPETIARYIEEQAEKEALLAALDVDLLRIVSIGWWDEREAAPLAYIAKNEEEEATMLARFAKRLQSPAGGVKSIVGFNVLDFDVPALMRRALYLGVKFPQYEVGRYRHPRVVDLMKILSMDGKLKYRKLDFYCKRFGIQVPDEFSGADIPRLVVEGNWQGVVNHVKADVRKERALAERLGLMDSAPTPAVA